MIANPTAGKVLSHSWWYHLSAACSRQPLAYLCLMSWPPSVYFLLAEGDPTTLMKRKPLQSDRANVTLTAGKWKSPCAPESPALTFTVAQERFVGLAVAVLSHKLHVTCRRDYRKWEWAFEADGNVRCAIASLGQSNSTCRVLVLGRNESCIATWWNNHLLATVEGIVGLRGTLLCVYLNGGGSGWLGVQL